MSRFKDLRLNRGFTQGKLAKELGTSQQTISRIEYKDELVPTDILIRASKYFNVSVDYILGLSDEKHNHTCEQRLYRHLEEYEDMVMEYAALKPEYFSIMADVSTIKKQKNDPFSKVDYMSGLGNYCITEQNFA